MRRWNGWGDDQIKLELPAGARAFLEERLGPGRPAGGASLEDLAGRVPVSRLAEHPLVIRDPLVRLRYSAGQSLPDWIALRSGTLAAFPDGVAFPSDSNEVALLMDLACRTEASLIPYGGGTSVVGHLSVNPVGPPVITVSLERLTRFLGADPRGGLARFQAGVNGPQLEAALKPLGLTLGHYPQSFEYSTLGGWVATRSSGQFSMRYGRIERLFAGGRVETPAGPLVLPVHPSSAAGPDLKEFILGSEGRMGIITECAIKVSPLPEAEVFKGAFFPTPSQALEAVREMARAGIPLTMMRLSLPAETEISLKLADASHVLNLMEKWLAFRGARDHKCLLIYGASGRRRMVNGSLKMALDVIQSHKGVGAGTAPGLHWYRNRFRLPYLRNTLWDHGYAVDTLETALPWAGVDEAVTTVEEALRNGLQDRQERVHVFTHLSHVYPHGSSIYTTYLFRLDRDPAENLDRWRCLKEAASRAIVAQEGTISHQHGVGLDHKPYLENEKGVLGLNMIRSVCRCLDPKGIMNPGKLVD
jgi:alkyldihydroxyacetonephosphate synthase